MTSDKDMPTIYLEADSKSHSIHGFLVLLIWVCQMVKHKFISRVRRRKSVNDMLAQLNRMASYPTATLARDQRAYGIFERYRNNIQRSLGYSNSGRGIGYLNRANMTFSNPRYQSIREINSVRVSRRTYMGLSNG